MYLYRRLRRLRRLASFVVLPAFVILAAFVVLPAFVMLAAFVALTISSNSGIYYPYFPFSNQSLQNRAQNYLYCRRNGRNTGITHLNKHFKDTKVPYFKENASFIDNRVLFYPYFHFDINNSHRKSLDFI
ncbi:hypothetical protein D3C76_42340 [compost metagenome]